MASHHPLYTLMPNTRLSSNKDLTLPGFPYTGQKKTEPIAGMPSSSRRWIYLSADCRSFARGGSSRDTLESDFCVTVHLIVFHNRPKGEFGDLIDRQGALSGGANCRTVRANDGAWACVSCYEVMEEKWST